MNSNPRKHPNSRNILNAHYFPRYRQGEQKSNKDRWADLARYRKAKTWYEGDIPRERSKMEIAGGLMDRVLGLGLFLGVSLVLTGFLWFLYLFFL